MKRFAQKLNWSVLPTKHTLRVSFVVFMALKGVPRERITESVGWRYDTHMIERYLAWHLSQSESSPAALIANELSSKLPFNIMTPALTKNTKLL